MFDSSILSALPQLGVGVASVGALVYITIKFMAQLAEREAAMRALEYDIRNNISVHLMQASNQMSENSRIMERVIDYLKDARN